MSHGKEKAFSSSELKLAEGVTESVPNTMIVGHIDPVWLIAALLCVVVVATRRLTSSNVERAQTIRGGHYQGKVTPGWIERFQKSETGIPAELTIQEAIRSRKR